MARGPCKVTQREITRTGKGLLAAGLQVQQMEYDPATKRCIFVIVRSDGEKIKLAEDEWEQFIREETAKKRKAE